MNMNAQVFFIVIHKTLSGSRGIHTKRSVQSFVLADLDIKRCRQGLREEPWKFLGTNNPLQEHLN